MTHRSIKHSKETIKRLAQAREHNDPEWTDTNFKMTFEDHYNAQENDRLFKS